MIESGFNPYAVSWAKAVGPWQFMPATGKLYGLKIDWWIDERKDPIKSTMAAAEHLKDLHNLFGSWPLALASYNAGAGKVQRAVLRTRSDDFWDLKASRYIRKETKNYVPKYMAATIIAKNPEAYGFSVSSYRTVQIRRGRGRGEHGPPLDRPLRQLHLRGDQGIEPRDQAVGNAAPIQPSIP